MNCGASVVGGRDCETKLEQLANHVLSIFEEN
jgi:hypothetical protein